MSDHYEEAAMTLEELEDRIRDGEATVDQLLSWSSIHASLASTEAVRDQTEMLRGAQQNVVAMIEQQERAIGIETSRVAAIRKPRKWWQRKSPTPTDEQEAASE